MIRNEANTTTRTIQPQMARPVAMSAGLRSSTVSVKLAIHGVYAMPRKNDMTARMSASV